MKEVIREMLNSQKHFTECEIAMLLEHIDIVDEIIDEEVK